MYYSFAQGINADSPTAYQALASVVLINEHGQKFPCTPGKEYVMSFKYKVVEVNKPGTFGVITSAAKSAWLNRAVQLDTITGFQYDKGDVGKGWQKGTVKFVCKPEDNKEEYAYIGIAISGDSRLYFDDLVVYEAQAGDYKGNMITFDSQGGSYCQTVYGNFGETINFPDDPVREGYIFKGWYVDTEHTTPASTVFTHGYLNLYAQWQLVPTEKPQEPTDEPTVDNIPQKAEKGNDQIWLFIIIGAGAVVIAAAVVVFILVKKKKSKKVKSE